METFSKLQPPEAVRIKVKLIEKQATASCKPSSSSSSPKDRRTSSSSQISTISTSSCTSSASASSSSTSSSSSAVAFNHDPTSSSSSYRIRELKKFCVDPQVTSFDVLTDLIAQAFAIKS